jgi:hypothetical protein
MIDDRSGNGIGFAVVFFGLLVWPLAIYGLITLIERALP